MPTDMPAPGVVGARSEGVIRTIGPHTRFTSPRFPAPKFLTGSEIVEISIPGAPPDHRCHPTS